MKSLLFFVLSVLSLSVLAESQIEKVKLGDCLKLSPVVTSDEISYQLTYNGRNGYIYNYILAGTAEYNYFNVENFLLVIISEYGKTIDKTNISEQTANSLTFTHSLLVQSTRNDLTIDDVLDSEDQNYINAINKVDTRIIEKSKAFNLSKKSLGCL